MTTLEKTDRVSPIEKFTVLASDIDHMRERLEKIHVQQSMDDLLETLDVAELGNQFDVSIETMRKKITQAGGVVFKLGKRYVIRKVKFLEVLESLETA